MSTRLSLDRDFLKTLEEVTLLSRDDLSGTSERITARAFVGQGSNSLITADTVRETTLVRWTGMPTFAWENFS